MSSALGGTSARVRYVHPYGGTLRASGVISRGTASLALVPVWRCETSVTRMGSGWEDLGKFLTIDSRNALTWENF